jgi:RNA polymerase sigma-70 factor, ECF subfamily
LDVAAAVQRGDRDAFRAIVDRESSTVVRVSYRILGNLHDAEDAAQETFLTAYRAIGTWRGDGPFGAWLSRITVRTALRHAGRRTALRKLTWMEPPPAQAFEGSRASSETATEVAMTAAIDAAPIGPAAAADPIEAAVAAEREAAVRSALARLEEPYREIVALRFFGDLSLAEIAAESGRPLGTVKTHLRRGLLRLRAIMDNER